MLELTKIYELTDKVELATYLAEITASPVRLHVVHVLVNEPSVVDDIKDNLADVMANLDFTKFQSPELAHFAIVGLLRGTCSYKQHIDGWQDFLDRSFIFLTSVGVDAAHTLRGLYGSKSGETK